MSKVTICRGLPASGKTTWAVAEAARTGAKRVNKDDLRDMLDGGRWSSKREKFILRARDLLIAAALEAGVDVIVDDTNLHPRHVERITQLAAGKAQVVIRDFPVDLDVAIQRDLKRARPVGEQVIRRMWRQFVAPIPPAPEWDDGKPVAVIVDMDGTLALHNGRDPYDEARCGEDLPNEPVVQLVRQIAETTEIVVCSGRTQAAAGQTAAWLDTHGIPWAALLMRAEGDNRRDAEVKRELYETEIAPRWNVRFVIDDRQQVVDLWRTLGLTCLQVADGNF